MTVGYKSCILVGHDWGAGTAWTVAGMYPELVDKLIVMNFPHPLSFPKYVATHMSQFKRSWYVLNVSRTCMCYPNICNYKY